MHLNENNSSTIINYKATDYNSRTTQAHTQAPLNACRKCLDTHARTYAHAHIHTRTYTNTLTWQTSDRKSAEAGRVQVLGP